MVQFQTVPNNDPTIHSIEDFGIVPNPAVRFWQHNEDHGDGLVKYKLANENQDPAMGDEMTEEARLTTSPEADSLEKATLE